MAESTSKRTITTTEAINKPTTRPTLLLSPVFGFPAAKATGVNAQKENKTVEKNVIKRVITLRIRNVLSVLKCSIVPLIIIPYFTAVKMKRKRTVKNKEHATLFRLLSGNAINFTGILEGLVRQFLRRAAFYFSEFFCHAVKQGRVAPFAAERFGRHVRAVGFNQQSV